MSDKHVLKILGRYEHIRQVCEFVSAGAQEAGLDEDTESADNHFGLGRAYHIRGRLADAEEQLIEAIRLAPEDIFFKEHLGLLYEQTGQPRKAIRQYQAILEIAPESEEVRDRLEALNKALSVSEDAGSGMGGQ